MSNHKFFAFLSTCPSCDGPMHKVCPSGCAIEPHKINHDCANCSKCRHPVIIVKMVSFV